MHRVLKTVSSFCCNLEPGSGILVDIIAKPNDERLSLEWFLPCRAFYRWVSDMRQSFLSITSAVKKKSLETRKSISRTKGGRFQSKIDPSSSNEITKVILYHKPSNVVSSHVTTDSRATVYDEIKSMHGYLPNGRHNSKHPDGEFASFEDITGIQSKLHAIGRLDADTTGLLLLTNDGGLVHHCTNPTACTHVAGKMITKTYEGLVMGHHSEESLKTLWEGVDIGAKYGGRTRPVDDLRVLDHPNHHKSTLVSITISEGRNRQVRRMFHAMGSGVMKLKRTMIGQSLTLTGVDENCWRLLSHQEILVGLGWDTLKQKAVVLSEVNNARNSGRRQTN